MKIIVAVCVHNRLQNIKRWIKCWQLSNTENSELVIIHNTYGDKVLQQKFQKYVEENNIKYVPRDAPGFDIGGMQDVFKERLIGFNNDWDYLLWNCDDTLPMTKDFISPFIEKFKDKNTGIACMQLSRSVSPHVRTTGFMISKEVAEKLIFPADPVKTKEHCYLFEHRGKDKTMTNQIRAMGLSCVQVAPINISPLWDCDHPNKHLRTDRQEEFNRVWGVQEKVVFITPIFDAFPEIISSEFSVFESCQHFIQRFMFWRRL